MIALGGLVIASGECGKSTPAQDHIQERQFKPYLKEGKVKKRCAAEIVWSNVVVGVFVAV